MRRIQQKNLNKSLRQKRTRASLFGTADYPRLSVFRSLRYISGQLIDDSAGRTLVSASSRSVKEKLKKTDAAHAVGKVLGAAAVKVGITRAVFHRGAYRYHGRVKAFADGCREAGLKI